MKILAFDISSQSTGVALLSNGKIVKSSLSLIQPDKKFNMGEKLIYFQNQLRLLIQKHAPDKIVIEDIFRGPNLTTFKTLCLFRGVAIKTISEEIGRDPLSIMASSARSLVGIGISKEEAFKDINTKYKLGFNFDKHNDICDAIVLSLAYNEVIKKGIDEKSISNTGRKRKRKRRGSKKGI